MLDEKRQDSNMASWFKLNEGAIGPPSAHTAAAAGMMSAIGLSYFLGSLGYLSRNWSVVLIAAGYAIPFAIARELAARRPRSIKTKEHKLPDEER
jgi:hypothetical protein